MEIKGKNEGHYFKEEHHKRCRSEMQTINGDRNKYRPDWSFIPIGYLTDWSFIPIGYLTVVIIHSKYFSDSDWLKAHV